MQSIQLYIKDDKDIYQEIELFEDESITLNQSIQDVKNISAIFSDYTQSFSIPASKKNNKVFKHFYNYFIQGFDAREKKDAKIDLNFEPFKVGKIKLEGASLKDNKPQTYKLTFFGSIVSLKDILGDQTLKTLNYFDNATFEYSAASVKSLMSNAGNITLNSGVWQESILFPLITHTDRLYYDSGNEVANANGLANVAYSTSSVQQGVLYTQLKPAIRAIIIFKAIEDQYPQIKFSDDFISVNNPELYNLFLWLNEKKGDIVEIDQDLFVPFRAFQNVYYTDKAMQSENLKDFVIINNAGNFVVSNTGRKKDLYASFNCTTSTSLKYNIILNKDGELFQEFKDLSGQTGLIINNLEVPPGTYSVAVSSSAVGTFKGEFEIIKGESGMFNQRDLKASFTTQTTVGSSETYVVKDHLPSMKLIDFLQGVFKTFNLTAFVKDGIIEVKTLDSFFSGTTQDPIKYHDITNSVDKNTTQIDSVLPYNQIDFKYKGLDTFLAKDHFERFGVEWGTLKYKNTAFEGQTFNVELPFEHMKFEKLVNQTQNVPTTILFGWAVDDNKAAIVTKPLLFYPVKATTFNTGVSQPTPIAFLNGSSKESVSEFYMPSNSNTFNNIGNLNFSAEINEYALRPASKTLFDVYYKTYINDLFKRERRLTKLSAYLPTGVVVKLKLSDRLIISDRTYKINKIVTNFETNKSNLELINVFDEREPVRNIQEAASNISTTTITCDNTLITCDRSDSVSLSVPSDVSRVPSTIPINRATPINEVPCVVTAATLGEVTQPTNTQTTVFFSHAITALGKICEVSTIESYGWVFASTSAILKSSDNIDTLKAASGVTTREFFPTQKTNTCSPKLISNLDLVKTHTTQITGLSNPATKFWRFFARTNTTTEFSKASIISSLYASSTFVSVSYSQTTNMFTYYYGGSTDNEIRTVRIMDQNQNLIDFTGIRGIPIGSGSGSLGSASFTSKIVPFVVAGLPLPDVFNAKDTGSATQYKYSAMSNQYRKVFYHATNRDIAINAAKARSVGNTGATEVTVSILGVGSSPSTRENGFNYEGITLYRNTFKGLEATLGTVGAMPDGFYATMLTPSSNTVDSFTKDFGINFPNSRNPRVKSLQQLNGITKDGQVN